MIEIEVAGVGITREKGSLSISSVLSRRNTAVFRVVDEAGALLFSKGQRVEIVRDGADLIFAGVVETTETRRIAGSLLVHQLSCVGWRYLADKRLVAKSYTAEDVDEIITDLVTDYLIPEGITIGSISGAGLMIEEAVFNYAVCSAVLDALAERVGYLWYINQEKELYFGPRTTTLAPFNITGVDILKGTSALGSECPKYRNKQYLRGGVDVTSRQTENRTGDGETASFAMAYPLHAVPTITVDAVSKTVGLKGIDTGYDWYWSPQDPVLLAEDVPLAGEAIVIQYYGEYPLMLVMENSLEIAARASVEGNTGIVEDATTISTARTIAALGDAGLARLARYGIIGRQFRFATYKYGLEPGQIVRVSYPAYGLTGEAFLIESVEMTEIARDTYEFAVSAVEGPEIGDWTQLFKSMADMKDEIIDRLDVGTASGDILIVLKDVDETLQLTEAVVKTIYACPIPADDLYPEGGLYPC